MSVSADKGRAEDQKPGVRATFRWQVTPLMWPCLALLCSLVLADSGAAWWLVPVLCLFLLKITGEKGWIFAGLLAAWMGFSHAEKTRAQVEWRDHAKQGTVELSGVGVVVGEPLAGRGSTRFTCKVTESAQGLPPGVAVSLSWRGRPVEHGERIRFAADCSLPGAERNPGQGERSKFLWREGVVLRSERVISLQQEGVLWWRLPIRWAQRLSVKVEEGLVLGLDQDSDAANVIRSVVLGRRPAASDPLLRDFRDSGALHLFAVSGMHVGLLLLIIGKALSLMGISSRAACIVLILTACGYATLVGLPPAAVRATIMAVVLIGALLFSQRALFFNSLALAAIIVLLFDSHALFKIGFQLSFGILTIIVLLSPVFMRLLGPLVELDPFLPRSLYSLGASRLLSLRRWVSGLFSTSLSAWMGSIPLVGIYFRMFTPVSVFATVLLTPPVTLLLALAVLSVTSGLVSTELQKGVNLINGKVAGACAGIAHWTARLPGGSYDLRRMAAGRSEIQIYDLRGGGNAIAVNFGEGLLIDCGTSHHFDFTVLEALQEMTMRPADVIVSHPEADAVGGLVSLAGQGDTKRVWTPTLKARSGSFKRGLAAVKGSGGEVMRPAAGRWYGIDERCRWRCLNAPWALEGNLLANEWSLVIQLEVDGWRILCLGDSGYAAQQQLLEQPDLLRSDVIISNSSGEQSLSPGFLKAISPRLAVMSHEEFPAELQANQAILDELRRSGCEVLLQSESGGVTLHSSRESLRFESFVTKARGLIEK